MAQLTRILTLEDMARKQRGAGGLDLGPYLGIIDNILAEGGVGGTIQLTPEESQRAEKGRLTRAARERRLRLVWRKAAANELRFVLAPERGPVPDARPRRPRAERQAEQTTVQAIMTPEVAAVTETAAPADEQLPPGPRPRRRRTAATEPQREP